ncbi:MAG: hotdog fold thioesterase [Desulfovibrionales bacterium]|nr:hotdog fold thioesterase [Desulfovibrionales bacterium]
MADSIWKHGVDLDEMNAFGRDCMVGYLDIVIQEIGDDFIRATMPVDHRTKQPMGLLHGGASVVLAESLGSIASNLSLDGGRHSVGLEIKANHIKSVRSGRVEGVARPVHLGKTTQVWDIEIKDEPGDLVCTSRLTMMVLEPFGK